MQPDRFAREIVGILALSCAARSRRLMRKPLAGSHQCSCLRKSYEVVQYKHHEQAHRIGKSSDTLIRTYVSPSGTQKVNQLKPLEEPEEIPILPTLVSRVLDVSRSLAEINSQSGIGLETISVQEHGLSRTRWEYYIKIFVFNNQETPVRLLGIKSYSYEHNVYMRVRTSGMFEVVSEPGRYLLGQGRLVQDEVIINSKSGIDIDVAFENLLDFDAAFRVVFGLTLLFSDTEGVRVIPSDVIYMLRYKSTNHFGEPKKAELTAISPTFVETFRSRFQDDDEWNEYCNQLLELISRHKARWELRQDENGSNITHISCR